MKGSCKLCGAVIETDPDPVMDADHEKRERTAFFNRIAFHIDPKNRVCTANNQKLVPARFVAMIQDNGWFQRWRLLLCLKDLDPYSLAKAQEWCSYLQAITSVEPDSALPPVDQEPTEPAKPERPN